MLNTKPDWLFVVATPEYNGKNCLYLEAHRKSDSGDFQQYRALYDIVELEDKYIFEKLDIVPELG